MSTSKRNRSAKKQLGQFLTPRAISAKMMLDLDIDKDTKILEPSFGDGSFIEALIERFMEIYPGDNISEKLELIFSNNLWGAEIDPQLFEEFLARVKKRWGIFPEKHNLFLGDFFSLSVFDGLVNFFDFVVGNPPFGGSFDPSIEDRLDKIYGRRDGNKIKKETYSFFIVKCVDMVKDSGSVYFICSDTFLTINTMCGLRKYLMARSNIRVQHLDFFSEETQYPMVTLLLEKTLSPTRLDVDGVTLSRSSVSTTPNYSWSNSVARYAKYFSASVIGDYLICSSGMTIGNNSLFLKKIVDGFILEDKSYEFFGDPITLEKELIKARLGKISSQRREAIRRSELLNEKRRNVMVRDVEPVKLSFPHPDYRPYNKATSDFLYSPPKWAIYWKDDGDAVLTYKKNGNWYLHGVGGKSFFFREGLTWQLISDRLKMRYLPAGYVLDSGAPCAFLRSGTQRDELYFILGWSLTSTCNDILKSVINHTRNIQSKDIERLPYPYWVRLDVKVEIIRVIKEAVDMRIRGEGVKDNISSLIDQMNILFAYNDLPKSSAEHTTVRRRQAALPLSKI